MDAFEALKVSRDYIEVDGVKYKVFRLDRLDETGYLEIDKAPYSTKILIENILRNLDGVKVREEDLNKVLNWKRSIGRETIPYKPSRVLLQDYTGVPLIVDLAMLREEAAKYGVPPEKVDTFIEAHLVVDHSIKIDYYGFKEALLLNMLAEFNLYEERYRILKWAQKAFKRLKVIPAGMGIVHQVNIEYLAQVISRREDGEGYVAYPDTLIGTDSHTPMVSGIGVLAWGVGGIEAEAVLLGEPYYIIYPEVIGLELVGEPREGVTVTDIVLSITEFLRKKAGISAVGRIVEFYGEGLKSLLGYDRVTISNMAPEYGATTGYFPIDEYTLDYLRLTGREESHVKLVEKYSKLQGLLYNHDVIPDYPYRLRFDLSDVEPSIAGPANPEDRIPFKEVKKRIKELIREYKGGSTSEVKLKWDDVEFTLRDGSVVISSITSCTNTSNPKVLVGAALLAKKAVEMGLRTKPWVKTSFAPGSSVVPTYLEESGLMPYLEALGYHVVGFGCTTCIGNSGPLPKELEEAIAKNNIYSAAVLSGNRNFLGRVHPLTAGNFLASPIMVVAYGLKGSIDWDPLSEPIGYRPDGKPVYLKDIWPSTEEIREVINKYINPEMFRMRYAKIYEGPERWKKIDAPDTILYQWDEKSTYIRKPPFLEGFKPEVEHPRDIIGARVLVLLGDRVSTDHISPAGRIPVDSPAGKYLIENGVPPEKFGTYGARRGNHEVMMRGTFANTRIRNLLVDREGGYTIYWPTKEVTTVYDAAMKYKEEGIPVIVIAGKNYGVGSSRDWAAKGPYLLGVKAVIAESFERIHRSNLIGMGILPLQFMDGENRESLGLDGSEVYNILGISDGLSPQKVLKVEAIKEDGSKIVFNVLARLDNEIEVEYYINGGILPYVLRRIIKEYGG